MIPFMLTRRRREEKEEGETEEEEEEEEDEKNMIEVFLFFLSISYQGEAGFSRTFGEVAAKAKSGRQEKGRGA